MEFPFHLKKLTLSGEMKSKPKREENNTYSLLTAQVQRRSSQWPLPLILLSHKKHCKQFSTCHPNTYFNLLMEISSVFKKLFLKKFTKPRFGSQGLLITLHVMKLSHVEEPIPLHMYNKLCRTALILSEFSFVLSEVLCVDFLVLLFFLLISVDHT